MKLFYLLLSLLFALPCLSQAQMSADNLTAYNNDGSSNPLLNKAPREWTKEEDQINGHIPHSKLVKMQNAAEAVVTFLQDSCFSKADFSPTWHGEYFSGKFGIACRSAESKGQLRIMSNDISPLLHYLTVNGKEFAGMRPADGIKNDNRYFEYEDEDHIRTITWLVTTAPEKLPYIEVTRKEYLQEAREELAILKKDIIEGIRFKTPVRSAAIQEAEKKASLEELNNNYSGADLQVRVRLFNKNYQTDEDYLKSSIENATAGLDKTLYLMDSLYSHYTAAELGRPAMVSVEAINFRGFEDKEAERNMLVKMNPVYFNAALSPETPQLFLVSWSYDPTAPAAENTDRQIRENIDFSQLQEMLGK